MNKNVRSLGDGDFVVGGANKVLSKQANTATGVNADDLSARERKLLSAESGPHGDECTHTTGPVQK